MANDDYVYQGQPLSPASDGTLDYVYQGQPFSIFSAGGTPPPATIPIWCNIGGTWKQATAVSVNIGGVWKAMTTPSVNIGGVWKAGA